MASFSFALSPQSTFGNPMANMMASGYRDAMYGGIDFANRLYDLQNRVALDPYAVSAAGSQLQEQDWRSQLYGDAYAESLGRQRQQWNEPPPQFNQPGAVSPGANASTSLYGAPQRLAATMAGNAVNSANPSVDDVLWGMASASRVGQQYAASPPGRFANWLTPGY